MELKSYGKEERVMKKIFVFTIAALSLLVVSCNKEVAPETNLPQDAPAATVEKTFSVSVPQGSKTELVQPKKVVWSEGDAISVVAAGSENVYTFTLKDGAGQATATFNGTVADVDKEETTFYAIYPDAATIDPKDKNRPLSAGNVTVMVDHQVAETVAAVKDGFSSTHAIMVAKSDSDGNLAFHFGTAFFKIKISAENVKSIKFESSGSARFRGRPSFSTTTFETTDVQSAKADITLLADGTLEKDAVYYVPVQTKQSSVKTLTLTFNCADGSVASVSTTSLNSKTLQNGLIYDLGCPAVSFDPVIEASGVTLEADATSASIAYEITNPKAGGALTAALAEECDWLTVGAVSDDDVRLTATANTGYARSAEVVLTYTYSGGSVTKNVTVSQKASASAGESHVRVFYYNSSKVAQDLLDGEAGGNYFTPSGTTDLGGDYNITSWEIGEYSSNRGVKLNSTGYLNFKTSATLNSTVRFWYIRRKSGSSAKIGLYAGSTEVTVIDSPWDNWADSGEIELEKDTAYTIKQSSGEQALLLVIVNETE